MAVLVLEELCKLCGHVQVWMTRWKGGGTKVQYVTFSSMVHYQHQEREEKRSGFYRFWMRLINNQIHVFIV